MSTQTPLYHSHQYSERIQLADQVSARDCGPLLQESARVSSTTLSRRSASMVYYYRTLYLQTLTTCDD
jgi:hypothetical protein